MTLTDNSSVGFSDLEPEQLGSYRPIHRLALVAIVVGIASAVSLIHPVFLVVPALGFILSLLALRQLPVSDQKQSGRALAILGVCFSLIFASWAFGREYSRQRYLFSHARQYAEEWLDLLRQGKLYEAHQLSMMEGRRLEPGESLEKHYTPAPAPNLTEMNKKREDADPGSPEEMREMMKMMEPTPSDEFRAFTEREMIKRIRKLGPNCTFVFRANVTILKTAWETERVDQIFEAKGEIDGQPQSFLFKIQLERNTQTGLGDWRIQDVVAPDA